MTAAQRVAPYELAMFRSADPTVDGALVGAPTRAVPRKDAIRACEEHAAEAVADLERKLAETYASRSALDCQYAGAHGESDGASHCPADKPCQRCTLERERDEARAALTAAHALLHRLVDANGEQDYGIVAAARKLLGMPESRLNPDPDSEHYHE
jgi:hypothetical protein